MLFPTFLVAALATTVLANVPTKSSPLGSGLTAFSSGSTLDRRSTSPLFERQCTGSCAECFGASYIACPADANLCYNPALGPGNDACRGSSGDVPTVCTQKGASCATCFGPGFIDCPPGNEVTCYNPTQGTAQQRCNRPGNSGPGSASASAPVPTSTDATDADCASQYGAGSRLCATDGCYNPGQGDVCCADGSHCDSGYTCVASGSTYQCSQGGSSATASGIVASPTPSNILSSAGSATRVLRSTTASSVDGAAQTSTGSGSGTNNGAAGRSEVGVGALLLAAVAGLL